MEAEDAATVGRMTARAREVADDLAGTARSLHEVAGEEEIDSRAFNAELDMLAFCCETCGWWCRSDEESATSPGECDECAPEDEDED